MYGYIYKRQHKLSGKIYIGQHKYSKYEIDESYKGSGSLLLEDIQKYGDDAFTYELIDYADTLTELNELETYYIELFNCRVPNGYNILKGGGQYEIDDVVKERLRHISTENWKDIEFKTMMREKFSKGHLGKSSGMKGKQFSEEELVRFRKNSTGRKWFNNGVLETFQYECPKGYVPGRINTDKYDYSSGKIWITDGVHDLCCFPQEAQHYLDSGWVRGRSLRTPVADSTREKMRLKASGKNNPMYGKKYINICRNGVKKRVLPEDLEKFLQEGWKRGWK